MKQSPGRPHSYFSNAGIQKTCRWYTPAQEVERPISIAGAHNGNQRNIKGSGTSARTPYQIQCRNHDIVYRFSLHESEYKAGLPEIMSPVPAQDIRQPVKPG